MLPQPDLILSFVEEAEGRGGLNLTHIQYPLNSFLYQRVVASQCNKLFAYKQGLFRKVMS